MPFPIDASKPFRFPSELTQLAEGVRKADKENETRWIEWKRSLDLTSTSAVRHIVRQIIGFANREPRMASQWACGYAYLLIGVEPGRVDGVEPVDPERIVSVVQPYVGHEILWTPEYVEIDGKRILIIIVEPPRRGDAIHVVRKHLDNYRPGTVLIRRPGQVEQADVDEMSMLQSRLISRDNHLDLHLRPMRTTVERWLDVLVGIDGVIAGQRDDFNNSASRHAELDPGLSNAIRIAYGPEDRPKEEYDAEVSAYLKKLRNSLAMRGFWRATRHPPSLLSLQMQNPTDRNLARVRLTVVFSLNDAKVPNEDLLERADEKFEPDMPERPRPFGSPKPSSFFSTTSYRPIMPPVLPAGVRRGWGAVERADAIEIEYMPYDLRPEEIWTLPSVPLLVAADNGAHITATWCATATNVDGRISGAFVLRVTESTLGDLTKTAS